MLQTSTRDIFPFVGTFPREIESFPYRHGESKKIKYFIMGQSALAWGSLFLEHVVKFALKHLVLLWRPAHFHRRGGKGGNNMNISETNSDIKPSFTILVADDDHFFWAC